MSQQGTPKSSFSVTAAATVAAGNSTSVDGHPKLVSPMDVLRETWKNYWVKAGVQFFLFFLFFLVGCLYYSHVEGWSVGTCIMFTIVTISTVGYGYQYPTTNNSRVFTIFYMIFGIYFVFFTVSNAITANFEAVKKYVEERATSDSIGQNINRHKYAFACTIVSIFVCIFVAGGIFQSLEGWSFVEGVYFAVETSTTVGYGDLDINNADSTFTFVIFYILFSTVLFAFAFNTFNIIQAEMEQLKKDEEVLLKKKNMAFIADLDKGKGVTEGQFILAVLEHLGTVDYEKDVKPWQEKFREMDIQGTGKVYAQALEVISSRESISASDTMTRLNQMRSSNQSAISGLLRPSFLGGGGGSDVRSPLARETFSHMTPADLPSRDRLTLAQASLLSHYA
jgi:hypothetical protein